MYDVAIILILIIVVFKLIKSEDSKFLNNNVQFEQTKDNKFGVNSTKLNFLFNFLSSSSNKSVFEIQKKNINNNYNNNNYNNNSKKSYNYIIVGELNRNKIIRPSDIQREISEINTVEKTVDIKEKRLGSFKRGVLKIPLAFVQMIAISIALICLLIP
ncbi:hypothetical protein ACTFIT_011201 [Dictyostelium discoideum]